MKCRIGDLAIVVRPRIDANLGMLVEVVGPWRPAENLWWVRSLSGPRLRRDGERAHEGSVADAALCPLRGDVADLGTDALRTLGDSVEALDVVLQPE
jgi:hypothetical protein